MNEREKYIADLAANLTQLASEDRDDALEFYNEFIEDAGCTQRAEIEAKLGTPQQLAHKILADYSIKSNNQDKQNGHAASTHSSWRVFWWVLLAIIASPITFGLGIAMIVILIVAAAVGFSITVAAIAIVGSIAVGSGAALYAGFGVLFTAPYTGLFYIGLGLTFLGLFFVCLPLLYWFIRLLAQGIANLAKYLYGKIQARRGNK